MANVGVAHRAGLGLDPAQLGDHEAVRRLPKQENCPDHGGRDAGTYPG